MDKARLKYRGTQVLAYSAVTFVMLATKTFADTTGAGYSTVDGNIWDQLNNFLSDAMGKFQMISTAAAGVGIATGALMKKFSMGKQDKIELGNKLIKDSFIGWCFINGFTLILNWLSAYFKAGTS